MTRPTRVFIIDGHRVFAESLAEMLGTRPSVVVVGSATTTAQAATELAGQQIDVVLVDPGTLDQLSWSDLRTWAGAATLAVLSEDSPAAGGLAVHRVRGWFSKEALLAPLVDALPGLAAGAAFFPPARLGQELDDLTTRIDDLEAGIVLFADLTTREREVLALLMAGQERTAIATSLHLSEGTVRSHTEHLLSKLDARSPLVAVGMARRYGWTGLLQRT